MPATIERGGIQKRVARIEGFVEKPVGNRIVARPVSARHVHAAEPEGGHAERADLPFDHKRLSKPKARSPDEIIWVSGKKGDGERSIRTIRSRRRSRHKRRYRRPPERRC
jgi:hypothetical protein